MNRCLRVLGLAAVLAAAAFSSQQARATESAPVPPELSSGACTFLGCETYGSLTCCSWECVPGGDIQNCG